MGVDMKVSQKFTKMSKIYEMFCPSDVQCDFTTAALHNQYLAESKGGIHKFKYSQQFDGKYNGYSVGKHYMDLTIKMWLEDVNKRKLYEDFGEPVVVSKTLLVPIELIMENDTTHWKWPMWFLSKIFDVEIEDIRIIRQHFPNIQQSLVE